MGRLSGKTAVVTGAVLTGHGLNIGGATVAAMAREGADVVAADLDLDGAKRLVDHCASTYPDGGRVVAQHTDISSEDDLRELVARAVGEFGRLDIMHNNATAVSHEDRDLLNTSTDTWRWMVGVNVVGFALGCRLAVEQFLRQQSPGSIINTTSNASLAGAPSRIAYASSKAAINILTVNVATQYGAHGIRCNAISPGLVLSAEAKRSQPAQVLDVYRRHTLTPYLGDPEHIAETAVFLGSDESAYITGQIIKVDGGLLSHAPQLADLVTLPNAGNAGGTAAGG